MRGSALLALNGDASEYGVPSLRRLLDAIDTYIPTPTRDYDSPFLLPIDSAFNVPGRGSVVVGTLKRGVMKKNAPASLLGFNHDMKTSISDIQVSPYTIYEKLTNPFFFQRKENIYMRGKRKYGFLYLNFVYIFIFWCNCNEGNLRRFFRKACLKHWPVKTSEFFFVELSRAKSAEGCSSPRRTRCSRATISRHRCISSKLPTVDATGPSR